MNTIFKSGRPPVDGPAPRRWRQLPWLVHGAWLVLLPSAMPALAAGGHHAVDDAVLLEPGQCQLETWWERATGGTRSLLHAGPACRVGAVELGLNVERQRLDGTGTSTLAGAQVKWARGVGDGLSAGVEIALSAQDQGQQAIGRTIVVPVTWQASENLLAHVNVGRDFRPGEADTNRSGMSLEWAPSGAWSFVAERFSEGGASFWRAGARWALTPTTNVDLSRAQGLGGSAPAWWTVGLTWFFQR